MSIVIDVPPTRDQPERAELSRLPNASAVLGTSKRLHYTSRDALHTIQPMNRSSLGLQAIHQCFAAHMPLELRPDTLWYLIVDQVAEHVKRTGSRVGDLFDSPPDTPRAIKIGHSGLSHDAPSDWSRVLDQFRRPLVEAIGQSAATLFLPKFTTTTDEDEIAILMAFTDAMGPTPVNRTSTRRHIPRIRLKGTLADWSALYQRTEQLTLLLPRLNNYFAELLPVLQVLSGAALGHGPETEFWQSIYQHERTPEAEWVTGWINAFFAYTYGPDGAQPKASYDWREPVHANQFPSHVSTLPFQWVDRSHTIDMTFASGILGVDSNAGFLSPRLGFAVAER